MSNPTNNGGSAYPHPEYRDTWTDEPYDSRLIPASNGMTLRDWFAGMALQEMIKIYSSRNLEKLASWSYEIADAMLAARNGGAE